MGVQEEPSGCCPVSTRLNNVADDDEERSQPVKLPALQTSLFA